VQPQKVELNTKIKTLTNVQKLLEDIQWVRAVCEITNDDLAPLMPLLGTSSQAGGRRHLSKNQKETLQHIVQKIQKSIAARKLLDCLLQLMIINSSLRCRYPLSLIVQQEEQGVRILVWLFTSFNLKTTVCTRVELLANLMIKGRQRIIDLSGLEPTVIYLPIVQSYWQWLVTTTDLVQIAIAGFPGKISNHYLSEKW